MSGCFIPRPVVFGRHQPLEGRGMTPVPPFALLLLTPTPPLLWASGFPRSCTRSLSAFLGIPDPSASFLAFPGWFLGRMPAACARIPSSKDSEPSCLASEHNSQFHSYIQLDVRDDCTTPFEAFSTSKNYFFKKRFRVCGSARLCLLHLLINIADA